MQTGMMYRHLTVLAAIAVASLTMAACDSIQSEGDYPREKLPGEIDTGGNYSDSDQRGSLFGANGISGLFGGGTAEGSGGGGGIGVNAYLWRASLDTLTFMPLSSADPFGGVIITDWYSPPETPAERFKMNVYILGGQLRSDGVRVAVFRQTRDRTGSWLDSRVDQNTNSQLENQILAHARELRSRTLSQTQ
ncbi:MAG: DUF3576 domain-containing protein [Rhodospirillales bacterium]